MFKPFNNIEITRFYSACFMIMLEALQNVGLIHRDIKQNNIMIEKSGYPRLIDFSCCKKILNGKTSTLIGTPYFMAPEILKGKKYSYSCDYWSVGVLIYYLFYGDYPFGNNTSQPVDIYKEIISIRFILTSISFIFFIILLNYIFKSFHKSFIIFSFFFHFSFFF